MDHEISGLISGTTWRKIATTQQEEAIANHAALR
jgi:hypothetical protein